MTEMGITVDQIMSWGPCEDWPRSEVEKAFAGRDSIPLKEILQREDIILEDRLWVGCHALLCIRWWCADRVDAAADVAEKAASCVAKARSVAMHAILSNSNASAYAASYAAGYAAPHWIDGIEEEQKLQLAWLLDQATSQRGET